MTEPQDRETGPESPAEASKAPAEGQHSGDPAVEAELGSHRAQFPALYGDPEAEVASRSADGHEGTVFRKTFLVSGQVGEEHPMHEHNKRAALEEAIQRGLHPRGEPRLVEVEHVCTDERRGTVSTASTYAVETVPSSVDHDPVDTATPTKLKSWRGDEA